MTPFEKSQAVRLVDVFAVGPLLIWAGARSSNLPGWMRGALAVTGAATIAYNGSNYIRNTELENLEEQLEELEAELELLEAA